MINKNDKQMAKFPLLLSFINKDSQVLHNNK